MAKPGDKFKTWGDVFDNFTIRTLQRLMGQGHFDHMESPLSIGKEANVFTALKGSDRVIVKIYRLETCDFNKMYDYIKTDPRYGNLRHKKRKIIFAWVQREFRNLLKAREAGVTVPTVHTFLNNVLVEEFIGDKEAASPLKDLPPKNKKKFFEQVVENMKKMYKAGLVHTDLSQFNILNHKEKPIFIDMGQCTMLSDPNVQEYFDRDLRNICNYFRKLGLKCNEDSVAKKVMG